MLLKEIYQNLDVYINQDGTDDFYGPDDFNRIIEQEQINLIIDVMNEEETRAFDRRSITDYLQAATTQAAASDYYNWELPEDYLRFQSMVYIPTTFLVRGVLFTHTLV